MQTRDKARLISLPRLNGKAICPYRALRDVFQLYRLASSEPLFQATNGSIW